MGTAKATNAAMSTVSTMAGATSRLLALLLAASALSAQAPLRGCLPDACLLAVEIEDGGRAFAALRQAVGGVPRDLPDELRLALGVGLMALPQLLGGRAEVLAPQLAGGGAAFGVLPHGGRPVPLLVLRPHDMTAALAWCERSPQRLQFRQHDELLLLAPTAAALALLQAQAAAGPGRFASWQLDADAGEHPIASAWVDLDGLRALLPPDGRQFGAGLDGGGRFLLGGLVSVLQRAGRLTAVLRGGAALQLCVRADAGVDDGFAELMPARGRPRSLPSAPPGTVLTLALDRSLRQLLQAPQRYLTAEQATSARAFLSVADQLDGYTSFVDDLLGGLREPWTAMLLAPQEVATAEPAPLQLPELVVVAAIADAKVEAILSRLAQAFVLIADGERGKRRQPPFHTRALRGDDGLHGLIAELPPWRGPGAPPFEQALSPTLAFGGGHVVVASTEAAARAVLTALGAAGAAPPSVRGDHLALSGPALAATLQRDFGPLVLARMLDEGEDRKAAERFWRAAIAVAGAVDSIVLDVTAEADATTLRLEVRRR